MGEDSVDPQARRMGSPARWLAGSLVASALIVAAAIGWDRAGGRSLRAVPRGSAAAAEMPGPQGHPRAAEEVRSSATSLAQVSERYHIQIDVAPRFPIRCAHGQIDGSPSDASAVEWYTPLFVSEFTLYPESLVQRSGLKRIVLCTDLAFAGQRRNAVPDYEHDTLYLDTSRGRYSPEYLRKVIHHEYYHILDYRDDGSVYADPEWTALNPSGFHYGDHGVNAQDDALSSLVTDARPGLLNSYSASGVEEDKAEMFANLVVSQRMVLERARADRVIGSKVALLKRRLAEFCPAIDDGFWSRAAALDRPLRRTPAP